MFDFIPDITPSFLIEIGGGIFLVVSGFFIAWLRPLFKGKKVNINWSVHSEIHEFLTEMRVSTHADRAQIIQFHNGEYFLDGISMQKLSVTHESLSNGTSSEAAIKNGVLISHFASLMEKLDLNAAHVYRTEKEKPTYFKNTLKASNVNSYVVIPLFYSNMKSGFLMLQWCGEDLPVFNDDVKMKEDVVYYRDIIQTKLQQQIKAKK